MGAKKKPSSRRTVFSLVGRDGFEPSKSLTADLQSAPFGHSGTYPQSIALSPEAKMELAKGLEPATC